METASGGAGVVVKATGITVACGVKEGGAGIVGRGSGREGSGGNSPVVTCGKKDREKKHKLVIDIDITYFNLSVIIKSMFYLIFTT